ncbi:MULTISPECIES: hypothetical protein [Rhodobacterales]|jgi:hypothetical protein|uniref:hypothetical protein n=1 Tax=Rhodobacterales TaxID=204455 RepID=UPI001A8ED1A9|nr:MULTISPECIES: hypothetical protein [Rhodobacterales]MBN9890233.1 hypothetical protein [Salipiger abyssi]WBU62301.1 hypothetical protein PAF20_18430 [Paracoccus albus]|tara:strand:- start:1656 stop:1865 length:210 start_codon:yes stop_codon:yes gene_type:complete
MNFKPLLALCAAASLLSACEKYTEKTSPCFGRSGEPQVTRAAFSVSTMGAPAQETAKPDCTFEPLPRPE